MIFRKLLKQWGNNLVLVFTKEEEKVSNLKAGDILECEIIALKNKGGKKR